MYRGKHGFKARLASNLGPLGFTAGFKLVFDAGIASDDFTV